MTGFSIIIVLLILGTLASLIFGVFLMAKGAKAGESNVENGKRQNKMMVFRIWFQAGAILVLLLFFSVFKPN